MRKYNKNHKGFTLIELIVVITILAILGTIGFVSYNKYSASARDSTRITDSANINKALSLSYTNNSILSLPDNYVEFTDSNSSITFQGQFNSNILSSLGVVGGGKDPSTKDYYFYTLSNDKTKGQVLTYLESNENNISYLNTIFAASDYSQKYTYTVGEKVGFFLTNNKTPIVKTTFNTGVINISSTGTIFSIIVNNSASDLITGSGNELLSKYIYIKDEKGITTTYPGCDTPDIVICLEGTGSACSPGTNRQIWSACNVGSKVSGTGANSYGDYYQWGRNTPGWISNGGSSDNNALGGSGSYALNNKYQNLSIQNKILSRGPCNNGYHVPTTHEYRLLFKGIDGDYSNNGDSTVGTDYRIVENLLKLPRAGVLYTTDGLPNRQTIRGLYMSIDNYGNFDNYFLNLQTGDDGYSRVRGRSTSFSVRCIKNRQY